MKEGHFHMRISKNVRDMLEMLAKHYNLTASATITMLISREATNVAMNERKIRGLCIDDGKRGN